MNNEQINTTQNLSRAIIKATQPLHDLAVTIRYTDPTKYQELQNVIASAQSAADALSKMPTPEEGVSIFDQFAN